MSSESLSPRPGRVVHWAKFYPPEMGGMESVAVSLARGAAQAGWQVEVVCFAKVHLPSGPDGQGVQVWRAPVRWAPASQPLSLRYLWQAWRRGRQADVVHLHVPNMLAALAALALPRRTRVLVHWHSDVVGKGLLGRVLAPLERALLRRADRVVATSQAYADGSPSLRGIGHRLRVVPIGVPEPAVEAGALDPAVQAWLGPRRLVLAVGRLVPYKGFATLMDAAAALPSDAAVVIVGGGPLHDELSQRIAAAGLGQRVLLAGRQGDAELAALLRRAALFCLPSVERSEAFGVVLVEAMTHGLPIVATRIPGSGVPWVNADGESGLNVPPGDAQALAQACTRLLTDEPLRAALAQGARRRYEAVFTEAASVQAMLAVYADALRR
ncbi:glycosyltransferase [Ideonella sp. 4Y16]|uniref:glycosyltransferase n=1 Tax=Ideonella alba TaxID=2824118 RepID=UPI001B36BB62|nr:glycosyltransferase [Ideonella alba]MBQ0941882.1 glycosyltransferase [Ideonella alba]